MIFVVVDISKKNGEVNSTFAFFSLHTKPRAGHFPLYLLEIHVNLSKRFAHPRLDELLLSGLRCGTENTSRALGTVRSTLEASVSVCSCQSSSCSSRQRCMGGGSPRWGTFLAVSLPSRRRTTRRQLNCRLCGRVQ